MKEEVGRLIKHTGIYGAGVVLSKSVGFLLIPVYTRYLVPKDYGVLELLDLIVFFAGIFAIMGIHSAVFRFYAAYDSKQEKKEVISTALLFVAGASLLVALILYALAGHLAVLVLGDASYAPLLRVVTLTLFFSNLAEVPLAYWRAQQRTVFFVGINLGRTILGASLLVVAIVLLQRGVAGAVYANLVTNVVVGLMAFGIVLRDVGARITRAKLVPMLRYGIPLIAQSLASFVLVFSDRFFLRQFASLSEVGVYSLGYKLAGVVSLLVSGPFSMAWSWQQFELAKRDNAKHLYAKIQTYQLLISLSIGLAVAILGKDVLRILTPPDYWAAARIVPFIALCYVLDNIRSVVLSGILVQRVTHWLALISAVAAVANLGLNYILISRFHAMGAAVATLISYAMILTMSFHVAQRVYFVRYEYSRNAIALAFAVLLYLASTLFSFQLFASILTNMLLLFLFPLVTVMMLGRDERAMFLELGAKAACRLRGLWPQHESHALDG